MHIYRTSAAFVYARRQLRRIRRIVLPGRHNIEEFLHGYCNLYLAYFLEKNPEWSGVVLVRRSTGRIVHAYAERIDDETGNALYADARGVYADAREFLRSYECKPKDFVRREFSDEDTIAACKKIDELELGCAIEAAYNMVYEDGRTV